MYIRWRIDRRMYELFSSSSIIIQMQTVASWVAQIVIFQRLHIWTFLYRCDMFSLVFPHTERLTGILTCYDNNVKTHMQCCWIFIFISLLPIICQWSNDNVWRLHYILSNRKILCGRITSYGSLRINNFYYHINWLVVNRENETDFF